MSEQNIMEKTTTEMAEYICDKLCKEPLKAKSQEELEEVCCECQLGSFICGILNEYNKINYFKKTQCAKLLQEFSRLRKGYVEIVERLEDKKKNICGSYNWQTPTLEMPSCKIAFNNGICEAIEIVKEVGEMNETR